MIYTNPLFGVIRTLWLFITGRIEFNKSVVGNAITMKNGKKFTIFRRVKIEKYFGNDAEPKGLFIAQFTPRMDIKKNIRLSKILMLVFMGFKGFRSKYWCIDEETGMCQGLYEWDKLEDAERYSKSIGVRNMTKRSVPGCISFEVLPNTPGNRNWQTVDTGEEEKRQFKVKYDLT
jgi:hypothetical protein